MHVERYGSGVLMDAQPLAIDTHTSSYLGKRAA